MLPHLYTYRSAEGWARSPDASLSTSAAARLRQEGFRVALSKHLRAWHGEGDIYPFRPGWFGTTAAVELGSPGAATAEVRAMIHDAQLAHGPTQIEHYRPFAMPEIPGARGYCVGRECRVVYTIGREVHVLTVGREAGARALTVGRSFLDRMRIAAARQFARLRKLD